jgi:hypothetical protein
LTVASAKAIPIYKNLSELPMGAISIPDLGVIKIDVNGTLMGLLTVAKDTKRTHLYQRSLEIMLCKNADGRGGEHYLLKWSDAYWDYRFDMPLSTWILKKQIDDHGLCR